VADCSISAKNNLGRGRADPADRVRESVEPAAGALGGTEQGVCDAQCSRCAAQPDRATTAYGEPHSLGRRGGAGAGGRVWSDLLADADGIDCAAAVVEHPSGLRGDRMDAADDRRDGISVRNDAGLEDGERISAGDAQGFGCWNGQGAAARAHSGGACDQRSSIACVLVVVAGLLLRSPIGTQSQLTDLIPCR